AERARGAPALPPSYQDERKVMGQNVAARAKELGPIMGELDTAAAKERDSGLRAQRAGGEILRHRLIPPLTQGLIDRDERGQPTPAAGTVFPQPRVATDGGNDRLMDYVVAPGIFGVS